MFFNIKNAIETIVAIETIEAIVAIKKNKKG